MPMPMQLRLDMYTTAGITALGLLLTVTSWSICKTKIYNIILNRLTILNDLPQLGVPRRNGRIKGTAVVCGGSVAGLLAARVCADHFDDVVIIEPEAWLATDEAKESVYDRDGERRDDVQMQKRVRTVQQNQVHFFLALILVVLRRLFPDIVEVIKEFGGRIIPASANGYIAGIPACPIGLEPPVHLYPEEDSIATKTFVVCRDTFERILRKVVLIPDHRNGGKIRWITGSVVGLKVADGDKNRVQSVLVRRRDNNYEGNEQNGESVEKVDADLVIDCTGASQSGIKLLNKLKDDNDNNNKGSNSTEERSLLPSTTFQQLQQYNPKLRYRTFIFPVPPSMRDRLPIPGGYANCGTVYLYFATPPKEYRAFALHWTDGHRFMFLCTSWGDVELPKEPSEILNWIDGLYYVEPLPGWVREVIETLLLESGEDKIISSELRLTFCNWIQYHIIPDIPSNFIALGDAVMRINPALGQGCTKACIDIVTLDSHLRSVVIKDLLIPNDFSKKFFKKQAKRIGSFWNTNKATDYSFSTTIPVAGESLSTGRLTRAYINQIMRLRMMGDSVVVPAMWKARHVLAPSTDLFNPIILMKVLYLSLKQMVGLERQLY